MKILLFLSIRNNFEIIEIHTTPVTLYIHIKLLRQKANDVVTLDVSCCMPDPTPLSVQEGFNALPYRQRVKIMY